MVHGLGNNPVPTLQGRTYPRVTVIPLQWRSSLLRFHSRPEHYSPLVSSGSLSLICPCAPYSPMKNPLPIRVRNSTQDFPPHTKGFLCSLRVRFFFFVGVFPSLKLFVRRKPLGTVDSHGSRATSGQTSHSSPVSTGRERPGRCPSTFGVRQALRPPPTPLVALERRVGGGEEERVLVNKDVGEWT